MMPAMGIHIRTTREVRGPAWAARYPERAEDLWVIVHHNGKRERTEIGPPTPENQREAERQVAEWHTALQIVQVEALTGETFAGAAARYVHEGIHAQEIAGTTADDRRSMLKATGHILLELGPLKIEEIGPQHINGWWTKHIVGPGLSTSTGRNYLDAISSVFWWAMRRGVLQHNPVDDFRAQLRRNGRTKKARASRDASIANPIEPWSSVEAIVKAAHDRTIALPMKRGTSARTLRGMSNREEIIAGDTLVAVLLMLDAAMRTGEVLGGLRWRDVFFGEGVDDLSRKVWVRKARARGKHHGAPKSGRERPIQMSHRLRAVLRARYIELGRPARDRHVIVRRDPKKFRERIIPALAERAKVDLFRPKQLRQSFGCYLLTAGVPLAVISEQLGHSGPHVTARHYARYLGRGAYRRPLELRDGEVPADLLARYGESDAAREASEGSGE